MRITNYTYFKSCLKRVRLFLISFTFSMRKYSLLTIVILFFPIYIFCQTDSLPVKSNPEIDLRDWMSLKGWSKNKSPKKKFLFIIPIIGSNPSNGFVYGGALTYIYKTKTSDRYSILSSNATYSTKESLNLNLRTNIFLSKDQLFLNGDWQYFIFNESTYGLGGNPNNAEQLLEYNHFRIHETVSKKIVGNLFAGIGFHYDKYGRILDESSNGNLNPSYYNTYNKTHGFNQNVNTAAGLSLNLLFDNRDNTVNTKKGFYANVNYRIHSTMLGSTKNSTVLLTDFRTFQSLDTKKKNILAFWLYGNFVLNGDIPYLLLPALGYDQRQRTGRGNAFGRIRGENMAYAESEYRFPISQKTNILGGVVFANLSSTSAKEYNIAVGNYVWAAYGVGLRIMMDKKSRTRLDFDIAKGNKFGFYLSIKETF